MIVEGAGDIDNPNLVYIADAHTIILVDLGNCKQIRAAVDFEAIYKNEGANGFTGISYAAATQTTRRSSNRFSSQVASSTSEREHIYL